MWFLDRMIFLIVGKEIWPLRTTYVEKSVPVPAFENLPVPVSVPVHHFWNQPVYVPFPYSISEINPYPFPFPYLILKIDPFPFPFPFPKLVRERNGYGFRSRTSDSGLDPRKVLWNRYWCAPASPIKGFCTERARLGTFQKISTNLSFF